MTPRDYLNQVVDPNFSEAAAAPADIRRALNAIHALDALAGRMFTWLQGNNPGAVASVQNDSAYRGVLAAAHADFALIRDAAKAVKHATLTIGLPRITSASQVATGQMGFGEGGWGEGLYGGAPEVIITDNNGNKRAASAVMNNARAYLEAEMTQHGM